MSALDSEDGGSCLEKHRTRKDWIEKENIRIRNHPVNYEVESVCSGRGGGGDVKGSLLAVRAPGRALSLSTLTGLSAHSHVGRPCQRLNTTRRSGPMLTPNPSLILQHGYGWISAEDQRILTMMVMRREAQMQEQEMAQSARRLWEKDTILYNQMMNEKRKQWNELVQERRKLEKFENERRKELAEHSMSQHIAEIERSINERHKRCEMRHKQIILSKPRGDTDADTELHRFRRQQQMLQANARSAEHISDVQAKEDRANHNLAAILCSRDRRNQERREERERRMALAQQAREAEAERLEEWCQQSREMLSSRLSLSECRHEHMVQWRRKTTHDANAAKAANHAQAAAVLNEEERLKEQQARSELLKKEMRIRNVQHRREDTIMRSRQHALTTASLRLQIKSAYPLVS